MARERIGTKTSLSMVLRDKDGNIKDTRRADHRVPKAVVVGIDFEENSVHPYQPFFESTTQETSAMRRARLTKGVMSIKAPKHRWFIIANEEAKIEDEHNEKS